jgi:hypothetical protein
MEASGRIIHDRLKALLIEAEIGENVSDIMDKNVDVIRENDSDKEFERAMSPYLAINTEKGMMPLQDVIANSLQKSSSIDSLIRLPKN